MIFVMLSQQYVRTDAPRAISTRLLALTQFFSCPSLRLLYKES